MIGANIWLTDENPAENPHVVPDKEPCKDELFEQIDRGVSICLRYDKTTRPKEAPRHLMRHHRRGAFVLATPLCFPKCHCILG
jgi:hypothetical protein